MIEFASVFRSATVVVSLIACLCGCSAIVEPEILPCATAFELGNELGAEFYEHVDLNQGSLSFWVEPTVNLSALSGTEVWLDLAGIQVGIDLDEEELFVTIDEQQRMRSGRVDAQEWESGSRHFVVVSWDRATALPGQSLAHMTLRVDGDRLATSESLSLIHI